MTLRLSASSKAVQFSQPHPYLQSRDKIYTDESTLLCVCVGVLDFVYYKDMAVYTSQYGDILTYEDRSNVLIIHHSSIAKCMGILNLENGLKSPLVRVCVRPVSTLFHQVVGGVLSSLGQYQSDAMNLTDRWGCKLKITLLVTLLTSLNYKM